MKEVKVAAIIPARMGSSRFPGKPLIKINNLPMIEHVRRRVNLCKGFSDVIVATCDKEIFDCVQHFGGKVLMTSDKHIMATDRVAEVAENLDCSHIVNVQGDEILILPNDLRKIIKRIKDNPQKKYWNAVAPIEKIDDLSDNSIVKCITLFNNKIIYCARDFSLLNKNSYSSIKKVLGILAYRKLDLLNYSKLNRTSLEINESIDQFRVIENDKNLWGIPLLKGYPGINEPREVDIVNSILLEDKNQKLILGKILD